MPLQSSSKFRYLYRQARILERNMENGVKKWKLPNGYILSDTYKIFYLLGGFRVRWENGNRLPHETYSKDKRFSICWATKVTGECNLLKHLLRQFEFSLDFLWAITEPFGASFMLTCSRHVGSFHMATSGTIFENDLLTSFNMLPLVERQLHSGQRSFNIMNDIFQHSTIHDTMFITLEHIFRTVIGVRVIRKLHNCVSYLQLPESFST